MLLLKCAVSLPEQLKACSVALVEIVCTHFVVSCLLEMLLSSSWFVLRLDLASLSCSGSVV